MPFDPDVNRLIRSGYDAQRNTFVTTVKSIVGQKPLAMYLAHRNDFTTSVCPVSGRVWASETITNLCTNGGFETNTTGWTTGGTNTIASSGVVTPRFGTNSCLFTYSNNTVYASFAITLATATTFQFSAYVWLPANFDGQGIQLTDNGSFVGATVTVGTVDMTKTVQWQRVTCQVVAVGGDLVGTMVVLGTGTAPTAGRTVNIDGVQIEVGATPTPYIETNGATATGQAPMAPTLTPLGHGTSRSFDGLSQYFTTPDTTDLSFPETTKPLTFVAVANVTNTAANRYIFVKGHTVGTDLEYVWVVNGSDINTFQTNDSVAAVQATQASNAAISMGAWKTFAVTYNSAGGASAATTMLLYENGVNVAETPTNNAAYVTMRDLAMAPMLGARNTAAPQGFFQGQMSAFFAIGALLTAAQLLALHNAARNYYQF